MAVTETLAKGHRGSAGAQMRHGSATFIAQEMLPLRGVSHRDAARCYERAAKGTLAWNKDRTDSACQDDRRQCQSEY